VGLKVSINGKLYEKEDARISVYDHGLLYGDGVFEGARVYGGKIFHCAEHVDRLFDSARAIALEMPVNREELTHAMYDTLEANGLRDGYLRVLVTRGVGTLGLDPYKCAEPQVIIIADSITLYPEEFYKTGLTVVSVPTMRNMANAVSPRIKSMNYLNNILAKIEALQAGAQEAVMLNAQGMVAECAGDNIFIVKNGRLTTPPVHAGILAGITRNVVLGLAVSAGIETAEEDVSRFDLYVADECFLTGTAAEIIPVVKVDGRIIGDGKPGRVTLRLTDMFREETANSK